MLTLLIALTSSLSGQIYTPVYAQAEHGINSVDTTPGTTVPVAPTDPVQRPDRGNNNVVSLPLSHPSNVDAKDAGGSTADRKAARKTHKVVPDQQEQRLPLDSDGFSNERAPRFDQTLPAPITQ